MSDSDEDLFDVFHTSTPPASGGTGAPAPTSAAPAAVEPPPTTVAGSPSAQPVEGPVFNVPRTGSAALFGASAPRDSSAKGGLTIVRSTASTENGMSSSTGQCSASSATHDPLRVYVEKYSGLRVRRTTRSFEQLSVRLAELPFATFDMARCALVKQQRQLLAAGPDTVASAVAPVPRTCVGVLVRKTDPKQSGSSSSNSSSSARARGGGAYAVCTLWNMRGLSPSASTAAEEELSLLLCAGAFDQLYSQLATGVVVALSNLAAMPPKGPQGGGRSGDLLLRVADPADVRLLGFAADLGTCGATARATGESCHALVNRQRGQACTFHATRGAARTAADGSLRKSGAAASRATAGPPSATLSPGVRSMMRTAPAFPTPLGGAVPFTPTTATTSRLQSRRLLSHRQDFFTVRGATGLPAGAPASMTSGSASRTVYGNVDSSPLAKSALAHVQLPAHYPSAQATGVSSRGRDVLEAARGMEAKKEHDRLLREALHSGASQPTATGTAPLAGTRKRSRAHPTEEEPARAARAARDPAATDAVNELRRQFAPLHRSEADASASFRPVNALGGVNGAVGADSGAGTGRLSSSAGGITQRKSSNALVSAVSKALREKDSVLTQQLKSAPPASLTPPAGSSSKPAPPASLIGSVADRVRSSNDALIQEAELDRMRAFLDQQIQKESALHALEGITEKKCVADYCTDCRCWYRQAPASCGQTRHRVQRRETAWRFYACEHCGYKASVLGEDTKPWRVMPRCPRCSQQVNWTRSNAAPETPHAEITDA